MFGASPDMKFHAVTGWSERDELDEKRLRSEILVAVYYEKASLP